jgi:hypothetical protein
MAHQLRVSRTWQRVGHVALIGSTALLLTSIAGAAVIVSPILLPLLVLAMRRTRGVLRWVYLALVAVVLLEAGWMLVNALTGSERVPAQTRSLTM